MHAPTADTASCTPGCTCEFVAAVDDCTGDVSPTCLELGGFIETCPDQQTVLDCSRSAFADDASTVVVCVREEVTMHVEFGYR
jgi:hypothetical protein